MRRPYLVFKFRIFLDDALGRRPVGYNWAESKKKAVSNFSWHRRANLCGDDVPGQLIAVPVFGVAPKQVGRELIVPLQPREIPRSRDRQLVFKEFRNPIF